MAEESIHSGHRSRLKRLYEEFGIDALSDHEVVELLLFYSIPRRDTNRLAHELLNSFGCLENIFAAPLSALVKTNGIKKNSSLLIKLVPDIAIRIEKSKSRNDLRMESSAQIGDYLMPYFINRVTEAVMFLGLDTRQRIVCCKQISEGNFNSANINIRLIIEEAIKFNAAYIVLAHNHPSGTALPSLADINTSKDIYSICQSIGVVFYDHLIFAGDDYISFADSGGMKQFLDTYREFFVCEEDIVYDRAFYNVGMLKGEPSDVDMTAPL